MPELRRGLPPLPDTMKHLPLDDRGYPVPWFVMKVNGAWDFRIADAEKRRRAAKERLCWVCGLGLGKEIYFVIGPMCAVNRNTSEPACHRTCAIFSATACPFLCRPDARYREAALPESISRPPAFRPGNPGAVCVWPTTTYTPYRAGPGRNDWLIRIGLPSAAPMWFCEGRAATRAEIDEVLERRLPLLEKIAAEDGVHAQQALAEQVTLTRRLLPEAPRPRSELTGGAPLSREEESVREQLRKKGELDRPLEAP